MSALYQAFLFARWPIASGLIIALGTLVFYPDLIRKNPGAPSYNNLSNLHPEENASFGPVSYSQAVRKAAPAVVNLYTKKQIKRRRHPLFDDPLFRHFFNISNIPQQKRMQLTRGSGVIVSKEGYLLTNNHVIDGVDEVVVALQDGREAHAELVGVDRERDLAVLKIDLENLSPISIGSPDSAQIGDVVLAIGNPFGLGQTVTQGIISATSRSGLNISDFESFIQTDAAINPGNSGGALIDAHGNLLGINTANLDRTDYTGGIGFAIPADTAMRALNDIVEFGRVVRGWLGVQASPLSPQLAHAFNLQSTNGVLVTSVDREGPADQAGLKPGDVITRINNRLVGDGRLGIQEIAESRPGETVTIEYIRRGQVFTIEAILGSRPITS